MTTTKAADVYVDEPYLSIRWDGIHRHVYSEWKAFANSAELRSSLLKGIRAISDHKAVAYEWLAGSLAIPAGKESAA